ncbi:putative RTM1-like protein [Kalaharituber pfeilii]|nr:putative RTM1-like protein [Kalaharituber pfeilii]
MAGGVETQDGGFEFVLYRYDPSLPAAIIFTVIFLVSTVLHTTYTIRVRTWYWIPFVIGGIFETLGYVFRGVSSNDPKALGPYIGQTLLLLLAPALFAASIYMVLGRIILLVNGEEFSPIRRSWMTKIFVTGDVLSFLMQSSGGGLMSTADGDVDKMKMGENVIVGGLFVQIIFFAAFLVICFLFWTRFHRHMASAGVRHDGRWTFLFKVLLAASASIMIRSVFRVIEYIQGNDGYLISHEVWLYIFDALLMALVMVLFNWCHPGMVVRSGGKPAPVDEEMGMSLVKLKGMFGGR